MFDQKRAFAAEFTPPDRATWVAAAEKGLRGKAVSSLAWDLDDGDEPVGPLVTAADIANLPHIKSGAAAWLRRSIDRGWRSRELVVAPDPTIAGEHARAALADGADEIELTFDQLALDAREPSADEPPGVSGIAIHGLGDFAAALEHIDPTKTRVGISAGEGALAALGYVLAVAEDRGLAADRLRIDLDFDPFARLSQRQATFDGDPENPDTEILSRRADVASVHDELAAVIRACAARCPRVRPVAIDGQAFHLSGAHPALEVASTIAILAQTARELSARGIGWDQFAAATTARVQVSHEILIETAKLRALRLLWAKVGNALGASTAAALRPRVLAVTSGRARAYRHDLRTNLLRSTLAAFAAVTGGADRILIVPYNEDPAHQDESVLRLARHQHHLLRAEGHLDAAEDPAGGAYAIELLTHRIAAAAWRLVRDFEANGGISAALQDGSLLELHAAAASARLAEVATRERTLVGINRYVDRALEGGSTGDEPAWVATVEDVGAALDARLATRNGAAVSAAIAQIDPESDSFLDQVAGAARAGATTGELGSSTWPDEATSFRHRFAPLAVPDGDEFEELRDLADEEGRPLALVLRTDDSRTARAHAALATSVFAAAGWDIEESDGTVPPRASAHAAIAVCGATETAAPQFAQLAGRAGVIAVTSPDGEAPPGTIRLHERCDLMEFFAALVGGETDV